MPVPCCIIIVTLILFLHLSHEKKQATYQLPNNHHTNISPSSPKTSSVHLRKPVKPTKRAKLKSPRSVPATPPGAVRPVSARPAVSNAASTNSSLLPEMPRTTTARRTERSLKRARIAHRPRMTRHPHQLSLAVTPLTRWRPRLSTRQPRWP